MTRTSEGDDRVDVDGGDDDGHWTLVQQARYEQGGSYDLTATIVGAIAEAKGVSPMELNDPVLYDCVDVAALEDAFFGPDVSGRSRAGLGTVEFTFGNYRVTVKSDGWISVYE
ncbi:HalOD1 output domain-containing protein [Haladaptatus sp. R4]|uniref:HalOD1 output domain-containing protein n=1 Tax=Haladaptatus sp. R4 TaxID=1679489 RepID=UPI000B32F068|nr:HalOD1 output domain-containing protein [Haladaptatus sp. R4]